MRSRAGAGILGACLALLLAGDAAAQALPEGWLQVDYSGLVDRRELSHSGESVGVLLERLDGRPVPPAGERPGDRMAHSLLEPLIEPYAFVLSDALDALHGASARPLVEVGRLWQPGEAQPAWAELLRSRRYLVQSDGAGRLRICLPWEGRDPGVPAAPLPSAEAARQAWADAWPVLRHVLAAERNRLGGAGAEDRPLQVRVHPYRRLAALSRFLLGVEPYEVEVRDTRAEGRRPPLDLDAWQAFLDQGLRLEGARLEADGAVRLFGSREAVPPTLLGQPLSLADLAVAYRAVFHGGLAEPYMSLDRGMSPQTSIVNYGGRLRDTALGQVSLLCDMRFKTFSLGLDIVEGRDLRAELRQVLPEFRTHMERFAADPRSREVVSQQTRLWFYPDRVDLTLSAQGDVLVLRRVRMSAASERVQESSMTADPAAEDPPWTRATVDAINNDYDALGAFFPELDDLDQVVRLLSLFTWLRQADATGLSLPELDALLALELPPLVTPRSYPMLLAFNALPVAARGDVAAFDRVPIVEALDRLGAVDGRPLPARRRLERALAALDPRDPQNEALRQEYAGYPLDRLSESELDMLAFRAERLRMHQTVLATLDAAASAQLAQREANGEQLRVFSVGIGGLDLGMGQALARAGGRSLSLVGTEAGPEGATEPSRAPSGTAQGTRRSPVIEGWRQDSGRLRTGILPEHGLGQATSRRELGNDWIEVVRRPAAGSEPAAHWQWIVLGADSPEVLSLKLFLDGGNRPERIERAEGRRFWSYRLEREGDSLVARPVPAESAAPVVATGRGVLPPGLAALGVGAADPSSGEGAAVRIQLEAQPDGTPRGLEADLPRSVLQRLILGRSADVTPEAPMPLAALPPGMGEVRTLMVQLEPGQAAPPWDSSATPVAGEEDPLRVARALADWWSAERVHPAVVVGIDRTSPARWSVAPLPGGAPLLVTAPGGAGLSRRLERQLADGWSGPRSRHAPPERFDAEVVLLIGGEAPGRFAARARELARQPGMSGKLLALWCLSGPLRPDLAAALIGEGQLAGVGIADVSVSELRHARAQLDAFVAGLLADAVGTRRVEEQPGPFLWHF